MKRIQGIGLGLVLVLAVGAALAVWAVPGWSRREVTRSLEAAEIGGDWAPALWSCARHRQVVRAEARLAAQCAQAARRAAREMENMPDAGDAAACIRALAVWGDPAPLAEALDRSRVLVPAGEFMMGSEDGRADERPEHLVCLDGYAIGRFEVANVQYARFMEATRRAAPAYWTEGEYPMAQDDVAVVGVTWEAAQAYCAWSGGRLPTEAEWERACRGDDARLYPWGDAWEMARANIGIGSEPAAGSYLDALWPVLRVTPAAALPGPRPVGSLPQGASSLGVMDLAGNAAEWVADWYNWDGYGEMPTRNPIGEGPPWNRSVRGSGWFFPLGMEAEAALWSRCSARNSSHSSDDPRLGFRCAYPVP